MSINGIETLNESWVAVVHGGVERVGDEWSLISFEKIDKAILECLSVIVLHSELICLVLGSTDEVHGNERDNEANWHVELHEEEQVEGVADVGKAEVGDYSFIS